MSPSDDAMEILSNLPVFNPRKWVECKIKEPIKKQIALEAVEAAYRLQVADSCQAEDFEPILHALKHSSRVVRDVGFELLKALAKKHSIVLEIIKNLLNSKDSKIRFAAIAYISGSYPHDFLIEIISKGLNDKSSLVRMIAADACVGIGLKELLPILETLLSREKGLYLNDVKRYIGVLKDGYYLFYSSGGHPCLCFKNTRGEMRTTNLKQEQLDKDGLQFIVAREMQR